MVCWHLCRWAAQADRQRGCYSARRNSEFGQYLLSKAQNEDAHFQEMIDATGFDPRRDLQSVLFASGGDSATGKPATFAILARGNFDPGAD